MDKESKKRGLSPVTTGLMTAAAAALLAAGGTTAAPIRPVPKAAKDPAPMVAKDPDPKIDQDKAIADAQAALEKEIADIEAATRKEVKQAIETLETERKKKSRAPKNEHEVTKAIKDLGDDHYPTREQAHKDLIAIGNQAGEELRAALKNPKLNNDLERMRRIEDVLNKLNNRTHGQLNAVKRFGEFGTEATQLEARRGGGESSEFEHEFGQSAQHKAQADQTRASLKETIPLLDVILTEKSNPELSKEDHAKLQIAAILALRDIGPAVPGVMPALMKAHKDKDQTPDRKIFLVDSFGWLGPRAKEAVPELLVNLEDANPLLRQAAAKALRYTATAKDKGVLTGLTAALKDSDNNVKADAADALGSFGSDVTKAATDALLNIVKDKASTPNARTAAAKALGNIKLEAETVVAGLLEELNNKDVPVAVRTAAADTLAQYGQHGKTAIAGLLKSVREDDSAVVRAAAIAALRMIGPKEKEVVAGLGSALADKDAPVRQAAVLALQDGGAAVQDVVPALLKAIDPKTEADVKVRDYAAYVLRNVEPNADIVAKVTKALDDQVREVRFSAAYALSHYGDKAKSSVDAIGAALLANNHEGWVGGKLAEAMERMGPEKKVVSVFRKSLEDPNQDKSVKLKIIEALGKFAAGGKAATPELMGTLNDVNSDQYVRAAVVKTFGSIGPEKEIVAGLSGALQDEYPFVRQESADALYKFGPKAKDAVPDLIGALGNPNEGSNIKLAFVKTLGNIGKGAKAAIPVLQSIVDDKNENSQELKKNAADAIKAINQKERDGNADPANRQSRAEQMKNEEIPLHRRKQLNFQTTVMAREAINPTKTRG